METVKASSEMVQDKLIKSEAENYKYKNMLSNANKGIRVKELTLQSKTQEVNKLNSIIQKFSQLKDGKTMSLGAIREMSVDSSQV